MIIEDGLPKGTYEFQFTLSNNTRPDCAIHFPDQRPLIIDVRSAETYSAGHIAGAISFPESDVDARIAELPKDKLIVAYCQ